MIETTFALIKPDAVAARQSGKIIDIIEKNGFEIIHMEKRTIAPALAQEFYSEHKGKPFFEELVDFISSGTVIAMALEKDNAVADWRTLMGATNPAQADSGTIRAQYGTSIGNNVVHGSANSADAQRELALFFLNF